MGRHAPKKSEHDWRPAISDGSRDRCHVCRMLRRRDRFKVRTYQPIGGDETQKDPGCVVPLPGAVGVPFVDGELP